MLSEKMMEDERHGQRLKSTHENVASAAVPVHATEASYGAFGSHLIAELENIRGLVHCV